MLRHHLTIIAVLVAVASAACQPATVPASVPLATNRPVGPTATFPVFPSDTPRATVAPVTPAAQVTAAPVPADWRRFVTPRAEIWLPASYRGGDVGMPLLIEQLKALGPAWGQVAVNVEKDPLQPFMYMQDSYLQPSRIVTEVEVARLTDLTLEDLAGKLQAGLPEGPTTIVEWGNVNLNGRDGIRLVQSQVESPISTAMILSYFLKEGEVVYYIGYTSGKDEFPTLLPVFEQSAGSFALKQ